MINVKRLKIIFAAFLVLLLALCVRIWFVQHGMGAEMTAAADSQSVDNIYITARRGNILDRNSIPLTNRAVTRYLILSPFISDYAQIQAICDAAGLNINDVRRKLEQSRKPLLVEIPESPEVDNALNSLVDPDIAAAVDALKRYETNQPAQHIIGFLHGYDGTGAAGLEAFYDSEMGNSGIYIKSVKDGYGRTIEKFGMRLFREESGDRFNSIKTTLDFRIQQIVEEVMENYQVRGAVVVEEVKTGNILAMASKPGYDPNDVGSYLQSADEPLYNRAVASYNAGSIFKIIDAASVYENYKWKNQKYECSGSIKIGNTVFKCYKEDGHGLMDITEAFKLSCNVYFIKLAMETGIDGILDTAQDFGWGQKTGIEEQGIDESEGNLPVVDKYTTTGHTANISIGQGDLLVTPLQACDMVATVANGGIRNRINIVDSIVDERGRTVKSLRITSSQRVIRSDTAAKVQRLMQQVTTLGGTGSLANLDEYGGSAGKTGTAEGPYVDGVQQVHAWFAGYFPNKKPEIAISVFVENGGSGGDISAPVFAEISKRVYLYLHNK